MELLELIKIIGPLGALAVFLVVQGSRREKRQELRFESIEKFCRDELLLTSKTAIATAEKSSEVIAHNTKVLEDIEPLIKDYLAGRS